MENNIIDIFKDIVSGISGRVTVKMPNAAGNLVERTPTITFMFGNAQYIKDQLDEYSKVSDVAKLPLVALFTPIKEKRGLADCQSKSKVSLLIACSSCKEWNNDEREVKSFENILRPIYGAVMQSIKKDIRLEQPYDCSMEHEYSENYCYGRYGAYTASGDAVSEPIDAINISELQINVKHNFCKR